MSYGSTSELLAEYRRQIGELHTKMREARAAAEPEEEPPGVCAGRCGLVVGPGYRKANSVVTVLPMTMAPASRMRVTMDASLAGRCPA